jgi:hypothetical protein
VSKTLDNLNNIQNHRLNGSNSSTCVAAGTVPDKPNICSPKGPVPTNTNSLKLLYTIVIINIILTTVLLLAFWSNKTERNATITKLSETVTTLAKKNSDQVNAFTRELSVMNAKIQEANTKIVDLKNEGETQAFNIETLTKSKNTLFNKINDLGATLDSLKNK